MAVNMRLDGDAPLNAPNFEVNGAGGEAVQELNPAMVNARATSLFTEGSGAPAWSSDPPLMTVPTLRLIKFAKEAIDDRPDGSTGADFKT